MNEDVPICHCAEYYGSHAPDCPIAAEVRALRKDRERLDLIETLADDGRYGWSHAGQHRFVVPHLVHRSQSPEFNTFREAIDAAMSARGGEDGA